MNSPWLSVIVPTYNGAAYLDKALESIACQHDHGVEVIAVDDGSTDDTRDILDRYSHRMPLRGEFLPFLFGGLIGGASGAFLAANRLQVIFLGQGKLGNALICGHSAAS